MAEKNYTITITETELKTILKALGKQPFSEVYEVIEKLVRSTQNAGLLNASEKKSTGAPAKKAVKKATRKK